ncbi:MAG: NHL repeat-containing protein [Armatimonadota bacterium]
MTENNLKPGKPSKLMRSLQIFAFIVVIAAVGYMIRVSSNCTTGRCAADGNLFDDKMSALEKTDPVLIRHREAKAIPTGLKETHGIALDKDGSIYVAGDYAIRVFTSSGKNLRDIKTSRKPYALWVDTDGKIYTSMKDHIEVLNKDGRTYTIWNSAGKRAYFTSIAATKDYIWAADAGNRVVLRYNKQGVVTGTFAAKDSSKNVPGLLVPSPYVDLAPTADGGVWVSNPGRHTLERYRSDGKMIKSWGKYSFAIDGFSGCCNPTNFAMMPDGRFVTSEKGIPRVKVYKQDGTFQSVVAARELFRPDTAGLDITIDKSRRILVLDPGTSSIRIFIEKGKSKQ